MGCCDCWGRFLLDFCWFVVGGDALTVCKADGLVQFGVGRTRRAGAESFSFGFHDIEELEAGV